MSVRRDIRMLQRKYFLRTRVPIQAPFSQLQRCRRKRAPRARAGTFPATEWAGTFTLNAFGVALLRCGSQPSG